MPKKVLDSMTIARQRVPGYRLEYPWKRVLDVVLSGVGLVGSIPLWAVFSVAIKLEDGGPVFYRQRRVGRDRRVFDVFKFRTLADKADEVVLPWVNPDKKWVTRVGRFLRSTGLDELPQLWNIFKGDMSFVGPRSMPMDEFIFWKDKIKGLDRRLEVRPGLTGLAQVYGNATRDVRKKLRYDLLYINKRNFWLDTRLILVSFGITLRGGWEGNSETRKTRFDARWQGSSTGKTEIDG